MLGVVNVCFVSSTTRRGDGQIAQKRPLFFNDPSQIKLSCQVQVLNLKPTDSNTLLSGRNFSVRNNSCRKCPFRLLRGSCVLPAVVLLRSKVLRLQFCRSELSKFESRYIMQSHVPFRAPLEIQSGSFGILTRSRS